MNRSLWMGVLLLAGTGALTAQQASQDKYSGTSNPPPDDTITTQQEMTAKPAPGRRIVVQDTAPAQTAPAEQMQPQIQSQIQSQDQPPAPKYSTAPGGDGTDDGIVMLAPDNGSTPALTRRETAPASDPDGDIVHPMALEPGTVAAGTQIRARLIERLSTGTNQEGDNFRATVASDVMQGGQILIPAGSEIDGKVTEVTSGRFAGHGSMVLRPQMVTLPDGTRFQLYAQVAGTPGANTKVGGEGAISPGSRTKKDTIEYGGGVGAGVVAGGLMGGPAGALAGSLVGAGAVTLHLMMDHPQATLNEGTVLIFSLTQSLHLEPATGPRASMDGPAIP